MNIKNIKLSQLNIYKWSSTLGVDILLNKPKLKNCLLIIWIYYSNVILELNVDKTFLEIYFVF